VTTRSESGAEPEEISGGGEATMRQRPTVELVILAFTATVCLVLILVAVAVTLAGAIPPNEPLATRYVDMLMGATAVVLGAVLGLLGGRVSPPRRRD
jgi:hypothetical protein